MNLSDKLQHGTGSLVKIISPLPLSGTLNPYSKQRSLPIPIQIHIRLRTPSLPVSIDVLVPDVYFCATANVSLLSIRRFMFM
jgi:hypothetical protein